MNTHTASAKRPAFLGGAALLGALALGLSGAAAAHAHVTISADTAEAGSYAVLAVSVPHGCDVSPTTRISIQIPEEISAVTPTRNSFYTTEKVMEQLKTPFTDGHGNEVTERVAEVVYTATTPLPADQRDVFELQLQLPEAAAGSTLFFPTVQTCEEGESAWVQIPADGQDPHELELPAPAVAVVAAGHGGHDTADHDTAGHNSAGNGDASAEGADGAGQLPLVITALAVSGLGLVGAAEIRGGGGHPGAPRRGPRA